MIAKLCVELITSDKHNIRKTARDLWDICVDLFSDTNLSSKIYQQRTNINNQDSSSIHATLPYDASSSNYFGTQILSLSSSAILSVPATFLVVLSNRRLVRILICLIKCQFVKNIIISLFTTLYNIGEPAAINEIYSEHRHLWPSSLANASSLSLITIYDLLNTLIIADSIQNVNQLNCQWLRTMADIYIAKTNYCEAFKIYIEIIILETNYFFKYRHQSNTQIKTNCIGEDKFIDEKTVKSMVRTSYLLNKHTHAAILCQFLTKNNDFSNAFRYLQDGTVLVTTSDEMDSLYNCIWDMTLLEYLTNLNSIRGFINKRNVCLKHCSNPSINESNPNEIFQKTVESKQKKFLKKLISYYYL